MVSIAAGCFVVFAGITVLGQTVFTSGIDVDGNYVLGNGFIPLGAGIDGQTNDVVRDIAPSIGQLAGIDPDTGGALTNGNLLTIKPKVLDLTEPANRQFVIAVSRILGSSTVLVSYSGTNLVLSVPQNSIGTSELDLTSTDSRYVEEGGDTIGGDLNLDTHNLIGAGNVGIGTAYPAAALDIGSTSANTLKSVLARLPEGNTTGEGTYLGVKSYATQPQNCKSFAIEHKFYGNLNSAINFYRGGGTSSGFLGFSTGDGTEKMVITSSGKIGIGVASPSSKLDVAGVIKAININIGSNNTVSATGSTVHGLYCIASGNHGSHAEGYGTDALGNYGSHAEGNLTTASGLAGSHAEGSYSISSGYNGVHAEGCVTVASGDYGSHAEGAWTEASAHCAHAEGHHTTASGKYSHAEGNKCKAFGLGAHAEGGASEASGMYSHSEGTFTEASGMYSHAAGIYAQANHDKTYVWSDGGTNGTTVISSTADKQFTVHAVNGIRLLGGPTEIFPSGDLSMGTYTNRP